MKARSSRSGLLSASFPPMTAELDRAKVRRDKLNDNGINLFLSDDIQDLQLFKPLPHEPVYFEQQVHHISASGMS